MNNNYQGYKQEIERILGKEWGDDTPRVIFPTRKERKSPFGVEGSLHYDIHPHWHRELDDNDK